MNLFKKKKKDPVDRLNRQMVAWKKIFIKSKTDRGLLQGGPTTQWQHQGIN